eukprot:s5629_g1.t1
MVLAIHKGVFAQQGGACAGRKSQQFQGEALSPQVKCLERLEAATECWCFFMLLYGFPIFLHQDGTGQRYVALYDFDPSVRWLKFVDFGTNSICA